MESCARFRAIKEYAISILNGLQTCRRMRSLPTLISLLIASFVVCMNLATGRPVQMHVRGSDHEREAGHYVSHGPYVFDAGTPPPGVDADLYHRLVQRAWDLAFDQVMGSFDILSAIEHSNEFENKVSPELLNLLRPVAQKAVREAARQISTSHEKRSSSSEPFMDVSPTEDRYLGMVYTMEKSLENYREGGKLSQRQYDTLSARVNELYRLPRRTAHEIGQAIKMCAEVCGEIRAETYGK